MLGFPGRVSPPPKLSRPPGLLSLFLSSLETDVLFVFPLDFSRVHTSASGGYTFPFENGFGCTPWPGQAGPLLALKTKFQTLQYGVPPAPSPCRAWPDPFFQPGSRSAVRATKNSVLMEPIKAQRRARWLMVAATEQRQAVPVRNGPGKTDTGAHRLLRAFSPGLRSPDWAAGPARSGPQGLSGAAAGGAR